MPNAKRGEVWQIDFGLAGKVRPALVFGCDLADEQVAQAGRVAGDISLQFSDAKGLQPIL